MGLATLAVVLRRLLVVARPDDWTGVLSRLAVVITFALLTVLVLLVRLPTAWVALAWGHPLVVRGFLVLGVLVVLRGAQTVLDARLPRAVVLWGRSVRFHDGTRRHAVPLHEVAAVHVEQRPPPLQEVFGLEERNGAEHDLCPTRWSGAPALHWALERRMAASHRRRARKWRRAKRSRTTPAG